MDDRRFDAFTRSLASRSNRRTMVAGLIAAGAGAMASIGGASAARRPVTVTAKAPSCPGVQTWNGTECACPEAYERCGPDCCPPEAECCDGACCNGTCYDEEVCCPFGLVLCDGMCTPGECCSNDDCPPSQTCTWDPPRMCQ